MLDLVLNQAVTIPSQAIREHVDGVRRRHPDASPAALIRQLEKEYLLVVQAAGGVVGTAAALPSVGTGVGLVLTSSDIVTFFASSAAFALAVADVHGIEVQDAARRRALLLATVLGEAGARDVERAMEGSTVAWGKVLLTRMPAGSLTKVNKSLAHKFLRSQLARHSGLALGRLLPFGVGAVIGVTGGRSLGQGVVGQSRKAFGPPPEAFVRALEVIEVADPTGRPTLVPTADRPPHRLLRLPDLAPTMEKLKVDKLRLDRLTTTRPKDAKRKPAERKTDAAPAVGAAGESTVGAAVGTTAESPTDRPAADRQPGDDPASEPAYGRAPDQPAPDRPRRRRPLPGRRRHN